MTSPLFTPSGAGTDLWEQLVNMNVYQLSVRKLDAEGKEVLITRIGDVVHGEGRGFVRHNLYVHGTAKQVDDAVKPFRALGLEAQWIDISKSYITYILPAARSLCTPTCPSHWETLMPFQNEAIPQACWCRDIKTGVTVRADVRTGTGHNVWLYGAPVALNELLNPFGLKCMPVGGDMGSTPLLSSGGCDFVLPDGAFALMAWAATSVELPACNPVLHSDA